MLCAPPPGSPGLLVALHFKGGNFAVSPRIFRASRKAGVLSGRPGKHPEARKTRKGPGKARKGPERPGKAWKGPDRPGKARAVLDTPGVYMYVLYILPFY